MRAIAAIATLRFREALAGGLLWLAVAVFAISVGMAFWVEGATEAARAAQADRAVLALVAALALLTAAIAPALGFPADVRSGAAQPVLCTPASRFSVVFGGALGYGGFATALLLLMAGAGLIGLELGGLGSGAREPVRDFVAATPTRPSPDGNVLLTAKDRTATFAFRVPDGLESEGRIRVRIRPVGVLQQASSLQGGGLEFITRCLLEVHRSDESARGMQRVEYAPSVEFTAVLPLQRLRGGDDALLTIS